MFHNHSSSASSNFQLIFDNALKTYKKSTKNDLLKHPLIDRLQACDSPRNILNVLQEQVQELNESKRSNTKWLDPIVNVLHTFSGTIGEGVGLVRFRTVRDLQFHICLKVSSPGKVIFIGFSVLLSVCTLLNTFVRFIVIQIILRQPRRFARTKTPFSRSSSAWKHFSDVWTYTLK
jgi:hypothetical protein